MDGRRGPPGESGTVGERGVLRSRTAGRPGRVGRLVRAGRRRFARVLAPVQAHPVPQRGFTSTELTGDLRDGPRRISHRLHTFCADSGERVSHCSAPFPSPLSLVAHSKPLSEKLGAALTMVVFGSRCAFGDGSLSPMNQIADELLGFDFHRLTAILLFSMVASNQLLIQ